MTLIVAYLTCSSVRGRPGSVAVMHEYKHEHTPAVPALHNLVMVTGTGVAQQDGSDPAVGAVVRGGGGVDLQAHVVFWTAGTFAPCTRQVQAPSRPWCRQPVHQDVFAFAARRRRGRRAPLALIEPVSSTAAGNRRLGVGAEATRLEPVVAAGGSMAGAPAGDRAAGWNRHTCRRYGSLSALGCLRLDTGSGRRSRLSVAVCSLWARLPARRRCRTDPVASCCLILHAGHVFSSHAQVRRSGDCRGYPISNASIDLIQSRQSLQVASVIAIVANISVSPSGPLSRHVGHAGTGTPERHHSQGPSSGRRVTHTGQPGV